MAFRQEVETATTGVLDERFELHIASGTAIYPSSRLQLNEAFETFVGRYPLFRNVRTASLLKTVSNRFSK